MVQIGPFGLRHDLHANPRDPRPHVHNPRDERGPPLLERLAALQRARRGAVPTVASTEPAVRNLELAALRQPLAKTSPPKSAQMRARTASFLTTLARIVSRTRAPLRYRPATHQRARSSETVVAEAATACADARVTGTRVSGQLALEEELGRAWVKMPHDTPSPVRAWSLSATAQLLQLRFRLRTGAGGRMHLPRPGLQIVLARSTTSAGLQVAGRESILSKSGPTLAQDPGVDQPDPRLRIERLHPH